MSTAATAPSLVLASASPRRLELLGRLGLHPEVCPSDVEERWHPTEPVQDFVQRVAGEKAEAVQRGRRPGPGAPQPGASVAVLGADTAVVLDGEPLRKPVDADHARWMLTRLSGRTHLVMTAVTVLSARCRSPLTVLETALVTFVALEPPLLEWYLASGEPRGKAGAYAIQGAGAVLVERIDGDPTTVIGLPLGRTAELLSEAGVLCWGG